MLFGGLFKAKFVVGEDIKEEAMFDFDLLGHDFYMFLDEETEKVCVLYNRKDGGYGLLKQA